MKIPHFEVRDFSWMFCRCAKIDNFSLPCGTDIFWWKCISILSLYGNLNNFIITRTAITLVTLYCGITASVLAALLPHTRYGCGVLFIRDKAFQSLRTDKLIDLTLSCFYGLTDIRGRHPELKIILSWRNFVWCLPLPAWCVRAHRP